MRIQTRYSISVLGAALLFLPGVFLASERAHAQCTRLVMCNYLQSDVRLCLQDADGLTYSYVLPRNLGGVPPQPPFPPFPLPPPAGCRAYQAPGSAVVSLCSSGGNFYPFIYTTLLIPAKWVGHVMLDTPSGPRCVDVFFDHIECGIWIYPAAPGAPCNP